MERGRQLFLGRCRRILNKDGRTVFPKEFRDGAGCGKWFVLPALDPEGCILIPAGETEKPEGAVETEVDARGRVRIPAAISGRWNLDAGREISFVGEVKRIRVIV